MNSKLKQSLVQSRMARIDSDHYLVVSDRTPQWIVVNKVGARVIEDIQKCYINEKYLDLNYDHNRSIHDFIKTLESSDLMKTVQNIKHCNTID